MLDKIFYETMEHALKSIAIGRAVGKQSGISIEEIDKFIYERGTEICKEIDSLSETELVMLMITDLVKTKEDKEK